jgi:hypothetical protein
MSESGTPEAVALRLFEIIAANERKTGADRKWVLDTYAECIRAVRNPGGSSDLGKPAGESAGDIVQRRLAEMSERNREGGAPPK